MKYVPHGVTCYIIYTFYNAMLSLRCHAFTTMPYFLLPYQLIYYLYLTYLLKLQPQSSLTNDKSYLRKNLNIRLLYLRNNLNVGEGNVGEILYGVRVLFA